jgi:hypothetical protein
VSLNLLRGLLVVFFYFPVCHWSVLCSKKFW